MIEKYISYISNYLWQQSVKNIESVLSKEEMSRFNISDYYYLTSIYFMEKPNFGDVAERLGLTKPAISAMVKRLITSGLLQKIQSSEDKRIFYLDLTDKARRIVEGDNELYLEFMQVISSLIDDTQMELLECLLGQTVEKLKNK